MQILEVNQLTKDYGNGKGVFQLNFSMEEGDVFGVLGPNGAGKTTTVRNLMGFLHPDAGSCRIFGLDCRRDAPRIMERIGYLPGEIAFFEDMTGSRFLQFMTEMRGTGSNTRQKELLERFELDPRGKIKKMSKGMKQKLALITAFMHDPALLLLDEPTSGLDPLMQNRFIELLLEERRRGKTILMSSHSFEEVSRTCHRVGIIREGRLVAVEDIGTLLTSQRKAYQVTFQSLEACQRFQQEPFTTRSTGPQSLEVRITGDLNGFIKALGRYPVQDLQVVTQHLEDVFLQYFGGNGHV